MVHGGAGRDPGHHAPPVLLRTSKLPPDEAPPFAAEWVRKVEAYRETLARARPDVLVMVGSDHFHQLWLDNMPQFLVGKAPFYDANFYNEEREFGLPRLLLTGHEELSAYVLREGLDAGFDLAFSNELRVDHSITCPIFTVRPQNDLPIVPIYTNIFAPPLPRPDRFVQLGRDASGRSSTPGPVDLRVAVIGTGHLSLELGGPRQFGPHGPDPEFDAQAVEWIGNGDIDGVPGQRHPREPALPRQRDPRVHGLHADDGGRGLQQGRLRRTTSTCSTPWRPTSPGIRMGSGARGLGMSKYLVNKFLFTIDRDPALVERYRDDPAGTVAWWEAEQANQLLTASPVRPPPGCRSPRRSGTRWPCRTTWPCSSWGRIRS